MKEIILKEVQKEIMTPKINNFQSELKIPLKQRILNEMVRTKDDEIIDSILKELPIELQDREKVEKLYWKYVIIYEE